MTGVASFAGPFTQSLLNPVSNETPTYFTAVTGDKDFSYSTVYVAPLAGQIIGMSGCAMDELVS